MKRKTALILLAAVLVAGIAVTGPLAYLTDKDTVDNTVTVGVVDITITEDFPTPSPLSPGDSATKAPSVTNSGANPCYVRLKVTVPTGTVIGSDGVTTTANTPIFTLNGTGRGWVVGNGAAAGEYYYYYTSVLGVGATTPTPAFSSVTLKQVLEGATSSNVNIAVVAEAVQSEGITFGNGSVEDYIEAFTIVGTVA
jgi:predicted ribosomally synthesized peptide with SipW-like signal peptide